MNVRDQFRASVAILEVERMLAKSWWAKHLTTSEREAINALIEITEKAALETRNPLSEGDLTCA